METKSLNDSQTVRDARIEQVVPLTTPALLLHDYPLTDAQAEFVLTSRRDIASILDRTDSRLLVIVGPCSVHDPEAALDYAKRLKELSAELPELLIVMRVYFEKPRTTT